MATTKGRVRGREPLATRYGGVEGLEGNGVREQAASPTAATSRTVAPETTALGLTGRAPVYEAASAAPPITAEIPAVPGSPGYGVLLPDGSVWYPGSRKRLPAPLPLRIVVWVLIFATLVIGAADLVIHFHPSWVNPIRRVAATAPAATHHGSSAAHTGVGGSSATGATGVTEMSPQPAGISAHTTAYSVAASSYTVEVVANHVTWVGVYSVQGSQAASPITQATLQAGQSATFHETAPVVLDIGASLATVKVLSGGRQIGTITQPTPWSFLLEPQTAG